MHLDFESDVPLYLQIAEELEDGILSGAFPPEAQIPSTTEISVGYKINPATVLKGVTLLADQDILYKKRGVGMFVKQGAPGRILQNRRDGFYRDYITRLLEEAEKLKISKSDIISMIEGGLSNDSTK